MSTNAPDVGASAKSAFTRTASGLVREMSIWDTALFGLLSTGGVYAFVYMYPFPQAFSPGVNVPLMIALTLLLGITSYWVYAGLGSAMPRAGGDYVYETRTVNRVIGFAIPWGSNIIFWLVFPSTGAYVINTLGIIPICTAFGLNGAAKWLSTPTGWFVMALIVIAIEWYLAIGGLRVFRKAQRFVFIPFMLIGGVTLSIVFITKWGANFRALFDTYGPNVANHITYQGVVDAAGKAGYAPAGFSLFHTMIWVGVLAGTIPFTMFAAQGMLGEVKDASNFGRLFRAFLLPGVFASVVMLGLPWILMQHTVGSTFLDQMATAFASGTITLPYSPNVNIFAEVLAQNKWVVLLISLGFIGGGFGISSTCVMNAARVMMAMSLDGMLPAFLNKVSTRLFTPVRALSIWACFSVVVAIWFNYGNQKTVLAILAGGMVSATLVVGVSTLGGALFAYTAKEIYASAPVRPYAIGSVPLMTIFGGIGAACIAVLIYWGLTQPAIGLTNNTSRVALAIIYASGFIIYVAWQWYERGRGVDVKLTTREVPPE